MKAIIYRQYGGPEVLEYAEVPAPKLSQNGVLIRVKAAALNPADHKLQAGLGDSIMDAWFPVIPGWDVAGVVERVGAGVTEFAEGDEVIGFVREEILHHGTYAENASVPASSLVRKPRNANWAQAAGLPLAGLTAYQSVVHALKLTKSEAILIHGASGGVGSLALRYLCNLAHALSVQDQPPVTPICALLVRSLFCTERIWFGTSVRSFPMVSMRSSTALDAGSLCSILSWATQDCVPARLQTALPM
jgi:NADPH:quinone reductase-like Zn-dependent oxidoreductase